MYGIFACMYVCALSAHSAHGSQRRVLDPLELELEMSVSHHVGARDQMASEPSLQSPSNLSEYTNTQMNV